MKFTKILEELKKGEKVTREKWEKDETKRYKYIQIEHGKCIAFLKDYFLKNIYQVLDYMRCIFDFDDFTAEDWKIYQEKENNKSWKPNDCDSYYYISSTGVISYNTFSKTWSEDKYRVNFGNAFKTKKEAAHMAEKIKIINKLRELSNIKFNETDDRHYMIVYNEDDGEIISDFCYSLNPIPFNIFFKTREDCINAISIIGEENLKKYYFDIVEEDK